MTKKEIRAFSDDELLVTFKAAVNLKQIALLKNELLRRLRERDEYKKRFAEIILLTREIDTTEHPFN